MHTTPPQASPTTGTPVDRIAVARGLIAAAIAQGSAMPDRAALDLANAWDDLDDQAALPDIVDPDDPTATPAELLLRARIALRQAIPSIVPARRALRLASAIRNIDAALARLEGWTDGGRDEWH